MVIVLIGFCWNGFPEFPAAAAGFGKSASSYVRQRQRDHGFWCDVRWKVFREKVEEMVTNFL